MQYADTELYIFDNGKVESALGNVGVKFWRTNIDTMNITIAGFYIV